MLLYINICNTHDLNLCLLHQMTLIQNFLVSQLFLPTKKNMIMKKSSTKKHFMQAFLLIGVFAFFALASCSKDDDPAEDPIASFQYEISEDNYLTVIFMNFSQNAETYNWDFGDGNTSTEENPIHTYDGPGEYEVVLTATNSDGVSRSFSEIIEIQDPFEALTLLAGETSKTWKLYRVGTSMGVGPSVDNPRDWWFLENDGSRPCKYFHEFTFHRNGDYVFDDKGYMWAEGGVFHEDLVGECIEAIPANMYGPEGEDLTPWLGGTHSFEFDASTNTVTLTGLGAWIGIVKVGTNGEVTVPQSSVSFKIDIEEHDGYDYMHVLFIYDWGVWSFSYAHYHDPSQEPDVVEEVDPIDPLDELTPTEMFNTFASTSEEDVQILVPTESTVELTVGVDDPADPDGVKVGQYHRVATEWQELQFATEYYIQFDNFTTVSLDVYIPSDNDFSGGLTKDIAIVIANSHDNAEWWNHHLQYDVNPDDVVLDEWQTWTFQLAEPTSGPGIPDGNPLERGDLNFFAISIGGAGHPDPGTFYIRNFIFD